MAQSSARCAAIRRLGGVVPELAQAVLGHDILLWEASASVGRGGRQAEAQPGGLVSGGVHVAGRAVKRVLRLAQVRAKMAPWR